MKKAQTWLISMIILLAITLSGFAGLMFLLDPLLQYGKESAPLTYYAYSEMYSNPGIAQHYEYDTVLVGTSMIENTDVDEFDKLMHTKAVRLPYSGGTALNMKTILDVCFSSGNDIRAVYWELDEFQLFSNPGKTRYPLPEYLYRDDTKEDLSYLLNLDIFYHYAVNDIIGTLRGEVQSAERRGESLYGEFSKQAVLRSYSRAQESGKPRDASAVMAKNRSKPVAKHQAADRGPPGNAICFLFCPVQHFVLGQRSERRQFQFDDGCA